ncbi:unnamed protein product [Trichogramma brassicae]|uniref:Uncharacterized protein n=1 Tax=Trichogramma brassicae TaxID=86971 RepID=A0A6H5IVT6_9HYME|nr:unnamed protein product [Trichogramma brassicae]
MCRRSGAQIVRAIGSMDFLPLLFCAPLPRAWIQSTSADPALNELRNRAHPIILSAFGFETLFCQRSCRVHEETRARTSFVSFTHPAGFSVPSVLFRKTCPSRLAESQDRTFDCSSTSRNSKVSNSRIAKLFSSKDRQCAEYAERSIRTDVVHVSKSIIIDPFSESQSNANSRGFRTKGWFQIYDPNF